jgi:hypothetical protein
MDPEIISQVVSIIAVAVATAVGFLLKGVAASAVEFLKTRMGETKFNMMRDTIDILVRGIEQSPFAAEFDGARKKEMVLAQISQWLAENRIPMDRQLVDQCIEAAVQAMKSVGQLPIVGE